MRLTIDVETNGLHGEAFAVGYVLTTDNGSPILSGIHSCPIHEAHPDPYEGTPELTESWLHQNVLPTLPPHDCFTTRAVRDKFYDVWKAAFIAAQKQGEGLYIVSDVAFPCETGFLHQVRGDRARDGKGNFVVYPLLDVSSLLLAKGYDPVGTFERLPDELPAHNPLNDARQSSRILHALLRNEPIK